MNPYRYALTALLLTSSSTLFAGNFIVDASKSELSANMQASLSHNFTSVVKDYVYDIEIDPETLTIVHASCHFKFNDLDSGEKARDKKMCRWMDIGKYPAARYEMQTLKPANEAGEIRATGLFTMHGTSLPITIAFTLQKTGDNIILDGHTELNYKDWGLKQVRLLFLTVDPRLHPHFHLVGSLAPDA